MRQILYFCIVGLLLFSTIQISIADNQIPIELNSVLLESLGPNYEKIDEMIDDLPIIPGELVMKF